MTTKGKKGMRRFLVTFWVLYYDRPERAVTYPLECKFADFPEDTEILRKKVFKDGRAAKNQTVILKHYIELSD